MENAPAPKLDRKTRLQQQIEQTKAQLAAIEARESKERKGTLDRAKIVLGGYAKIHAPALLDQAIEDYEKKSSRTSKEESDLKALRVYKG